MTKKKKVMSKKIRYTSDGSPSGGSITSPIPPPARTPWYRWKTKHWNRTRIMLLMPEVSKPVEFKIDLIKMYVP